MGSKKDLTNAGRTSGCKFLSCRAVARLSLCVAAIGISLPAAAQRTIADVAQQDLTIGRAWTSADAEGLGRLHIEVFIKVPSSFGGGRVLVDDNGHPISRPTVEYRVCVEPCDGSSGIAAAAGSFRIADPPKASQEVVTDFRVPVRDTRPSETIPVRMTLILPKDVADSNPSNNSVTLTMPFESYEYAIERLHGAMIVDNGAHWIKARAWYAWPENLPNSVRPSLWDAFQLYIVTSAGDRVRLHCTFGRPYRVADNYLRTEPRAYAEYFCLTPQTVARALRFELDMSYWGRALGGWGDRIQTFKIPLPKGSGWRYEYPIASLPPLPDVRSGVLRVCRGAGGKVYATAFISNVGFVDADSTVSELVLSYVPSVKSVSLLTERISVGGVVSARTEIPYEFSPQDPRPPRRIALCADAAGGLIEVDEVKNLQGMELNNCTQVENPPPTSELVACGE